MHDPTAQPADDTGLPAATEASATAAAPAVLVSPAAADALLSDDAAFAAADQTAAASPADAGESAADVDCAEANAGAPADPVTDASALEPATPAGAAVATPAALAELSPAACAARLAALFPALFKGPAKPLKLRIQADIQQRAPGVFTRRSLSAFLHRHTTSTAYLVALSQAQERVDLDGAAAGELADEHRQAAITELARRRALHEERRAAENAARRAAEAQARQAHAAADQARRERALLLRAFETSTLTRANFCALKRIDEAELDGLLTTARQEALQSGFGNPAERRPDPARPARPDGRDGRQDGRGSGERHHAGPRPRPDGSARRPVAAKPPR